MPTPRPTADVMPDLRGLSAREALRALTKLGMTARMAGDGFVLEQSPAAGSALGTADACIAEAGTASGCRSPRRCAAVTLGALLRAVAERAAVPRRDRAGSCPARVAACATCRAIAYDSRTVAPGSVFVALRGLHADGARVRARRRGARRRRSSSPRRPRRPGLRCAVAAGERRPARARRARRRVLRRSEPRAALVGVTGTNGKTTTTYLLAVDLRGRRRDVRAHRHYRLSRSAIMRPTRPGRRPKRRTCSACCARWCRAGRGACVIEVSSHALALRRADHLRFAAGDLHQPDARPPRFPPRHGGLLRGQAAAVRAAAGRRVRRVEPRRPRAAPRSRPPRRGP